MDRSNSKVSDFDRRASVRRSMQISLNGGESDEVDEISEQLLGVADGFRPPTGDVPNDAFRAPSRTSTMASATPSTLPSNNPLTTSRMSPRTRPSSIAKPPRPSRDSFALRHDGAMGPISEPLLSHVPDVPGDASAATADPPEDLYSGPDGPSHPYQMYPQNVRVTRTLSMATSSTTPVPETSYDGPRGPTHPYGLYTQNTVLIPSMSQDPQPASVQVGFPGVPDNYQRRLGPDGEEIADMIGPDGHTEQLPPYTRYPDEAYARKVREAEQLSAPAPEPEPMPVTRPAPVLRPIPGAGGLGLATLNPEFESMEDLHSQSRRSMRSLTTENSRHTINMAAAIMSEKPITARWQRTAKKRLFGLVPRWGLCLIIVVLIVMAAIMGAVIGAWITRHHHFHPPPANSSGGPSTVTITYDATPIPTPSNLPVLPTGTFLTPLTINQAPATCFNNTMQTAAWSCNLVNNGLVNLTLTVSHVDVFLDRPHYDISMQCNQSLTAATNQLSYGAQPPVIPGTHTLELVNDTADFARGPAWFKMVPYNKTVVLPQQALSPLFENSPPQHRRYARGDFGLGDFVRKSVATPGEQPWICTWPETLIEVFIFPEQNTSSSNPPTTTPSPSPSSTTPPGSPPTTNMGGYQSTTSTPRPAPSSSTAITNSGSGDLYVPPLFPKVMKVEERRLAGSPPATCKQVFVHSSGAIIPVYDTSGNPIVMVIAETEPTGYSTPSKRDLSREVFPRDPDYMSYCGCLWFAP